MKYIQNVVVALTVCLFIRGITLEFPDLIDPTESRYAFVAQEMYLSGDWVMPKLPTVQGVEPYLGKPPLHFWLTAQSFSLFGMDEWVGRLPSFLSLFVMVGCILYLRRFEAFSRSCWSGALTLISSSLMYFMSGASVVDVTLAATVSVTFVAAYTLLKTGSSLSSLTMFLALGLGVLTKGPIAIALFGFAGLAWTAITRRYDALKLPRYLIGIAAFLIVTVPWFWFAQAQNSEFIRYFFLNENFGRYFLSDYGDRYGTGHKYPFGTIWGMFIVGFLPWTVPLLVELYVRRREITKLSFWRSNPDLLYVTLWAISPVMLFTFARQLHAAYILPGIPGMALLTALLLENAPSQRIEYIFNGLVALVASLALIAVILGLNFGTNIEYLLVALVPVATLVIATLNLRLQRATISTVAVVVVSGYAITTLLLARNIGERRSAETILRCITHFDPHRQPNIGVVNANNYSIYFYTRAWKEEFEKPMRTSFYTTDRLPKKLPENLLLRTNEVDQIRNFLPKGYTVVYPTRAWTWMKRGAPLSIVECPTDT